MSDVASYGGIYCKIFKKDSRLFATQSFTNSTSGSLFNGKPVICGGSNPNGKVSSVCSIFEKKSWRKFAQMSESRQYHTSIQIDENRLWVIGKNLWIRGLLKRLLFCTHNYCSCCITVCRLLYAIFISKVI